eukprot:TRINITY_DN2132_c0_g1_i3.p1 TRINITY_DN2132_c0_g1~~TRINITY_DN2132_c0_g1_i3.p1  ORF type:complete len:772 (-),score=193.80 TRINITY_DN2132_c0_g1_i3:85-2400(-)
MQEVMKEKKQGEDDKGRSLDDCKLIGKKMENSDLVDYLRSNILGKENVFVGPFGPRQVTYCDYTASGRPLECIEEYIKTKVLPFYANTHSTSSTYGYQSTLFRNEARQIIAEALNAKAESDVVLFSGRGVTGAVNQLVQVLIKSVGLGEGSVVFNSPYEHHSSILPWREVGCKVVTIREHHSGRIDYKHLKEELKLHENWKVKIGSFSAASNVTGVLSNIEKITILLHRYKALSFWDFATAGPYLKIDMNPTVEGPHADLAYKDAVFISTHKFMGGPGTPGLLVAKKALFNLDCPPSSPGGGTVFFVTEQKHQYLDNILEREEGGTPDIVGSIRAGLVFKVKQSIGVQTIQGLEHDFAIRAEKRLMGIANLYLLGPSISKVRKLAIFSFLISDPSKPGMHFLHYNFVCALLNDLFGIQSRGGCACAGPYAQVLLGISNELAQNYQDLLIQGENEGLKPGFIRLNFNYFITEEEFEFILSSIEFVCKEGWKFLPQYSFNEATNEWKHISNVKAMQCLHLDSFALKDGKVIWPEAVHYQTGSYRDYLDEANKLASNIKIEIDKNVDPTQPEKLVWFEYPEEAGKCTKSCSPFCPHEYKKTGKCNSPKGNTENDKGAHGKSKRHRMSERCTTDHKSTQPDNTSKHVHEKTKEKHHHTNQKDNKEKHKNTQKEAEKEKEKLTPEKQKEPEKDKEKVKTTLKEHRTAQKEPEKDKTAPKEPEKDKTAYKEPEKDKTAHKEPEKDKEGDSKKGEKEKRNIKKGKSSPQVKQTKRLKG